MANNQYAIWIDQNVDNPENTEYSKELKSIDPLLKVEVFKEINKAIKYMKTIKFDQTKVIISSKLYSEFIQKFKENIRDMCVAPKIIIFTMDKKKFYEKNKDNESNNDLFYKYEEVTTEFDEIKKFLEFEKIEKIEKIKNQNPPENDKSYETQFTFQYINSEEDLMLPLLFKSLIEDTSIDNMKEYTNSIYNTYSEKYYKLKILLNSIKSMEKVPIEILSKFYARLYTLESSFYKDIKEDLGLNKKEKYLPYIKTLYEGVKLESLSLASDNILYRGSIISNEELKNIESSLNKKNKNLPPVIAFSKLFLSFSKNKKNAEEFYIKPNKALNSSKVLYIVEKDDFIGYNLSTHGDIEEISYFKEEQEVLFFPFSSFEIKEVKEINIEGQKGYEIRLLYLGKYLEKIEKDKKIINKEDKIPESDFKTQLIEFGLIKPEKLKTIKINELFKQYKKYEEYIIINHMKNNSITGEINISSNDINKDIQIINSFENFKRMEKLEDQEDDYKYKNEKEIKENIEIKINGEKINFSYIYKFNKEGKYKIEYFFKKNLKKTNHMFYNCTSLTNLNLSHFNTQNVTNMGLMFSGCNSLKNLNLLYLKTPNVTDMHDMFSGCNSLKNLDLSNFNTQKVKDMSGMFFDCKSLKNIDLSTFNTKNVEAIFSMFYGCNSLEDLDLSNFNTQKVNHMSGMFYDCTSLKNLNLSNFNFRSVNHRDAMFSNCNSLERLNLSNIKTKNVNDISTMLSGTSLKRKDIITNDENILNNFK